MEFGRKTYLKNFGFDYWDLFGNWKLRFGNLSSLMFFRNFTYGQKY